MTVPTNRTVVTAAVHDWARSETCCAPCGSADAWPATSAATGATSTPTTGPSTTAPCAPDGDGSCPSYRVPAEIAGTIAEPKVWVITDDLEDPDTATTILWPSDY